MSNETPNSGDDTPESSEAAPVGRARARQPWWIPRFLGRIPEELEPHHLRVIGLIALALLFENYDIATLGAAVKHIREDFGFEQAQMPRIISIVRLGALPGLLVILPLADRIGRRRLFLASVAGMGLASLFTAFATAPWLFVAFQMIARTCYIASAVSVFVIASEELPPSVRGWGIGVLGALGAFGFGLSALVFGMIDWLPYGWRFMYVVGVAPLFLLPLLRREIHETSHFETYGTAKQQPGESVWRLAGGWWRAYGSLIRGAPVRTLGVTVVAFLSAGAHAPSFSLLADYVLTDRGWTPSQYSIMVILGGLVGIIGNTAAGRAADLYGRRRVGVMLLILYPLIAWVLYNSTGWLIVAAWTPLVFTLTGSNTVLRAVCTELFPTAVRATATGWLMLCETLGAAVVLYSVTLLTPVDESTAGVISGLAFLSAGAAVAMMFFPETKGRDLEVLEVEGRGSTPS